MQAIIYTVNANGIEQIRVFLAANHKLGGDHFTTDMLRAWAQEAEFQLAEGNPASIELSAWNSISGHTETFDLSADGLDAQTVEIDE